MKKKSNFNRQNFKSKRIKTTNYNSNCIIQLQKIKQNNHHRHSSHYKKYVNKINWE